MAAPAAILPLSSPSCRRQARVLLLLAALLAASTAPAQGRRQLQQSFQFFRGRPRPLPWWRQFHGELRSEVQEADSSQGFEVLFLGDSLTEALRGTRDGGAKSFPDIAAVFQRHVGDRYHARPLGIGGDTTQNLMWRLRNGELPLRQRPRLVLVLIGTNDVRTGAMTNVDAAVSGTVERVQLLVKYLKRRLRSSQIAMIGLLPRGSPGGANPYQQSFPDAWDRVNEGYRALAERTRRLHYIGCGGPLLLAACGVAAAAGAQPQLEPTLMQDHTHPNAAGYELLFSQCWDAAIARIMGGERKVIATPAPLPTAAAVAAAAAAAAASSAAYASTAGLDAGGQGQQGAAKR